MTIRRRLPLSSSETVLAATVDKEATATDPEALVNPEAHYLNDEEIPLSTSGIGNGMIESRSCTTFDLRLFVMTNI